MSKFCMNCGKEMNDDDMFCTVCGTNQNADSAAPVAPAVTEAPVAPEAPAAPVAPAKDPIDFKAVMGDVLAGLKSTGGAVMSKIAAKKGLFIIIAAAVVAVIAAALVFGILFGSTEKGAVTDYLELAYAYDSDALSDTIPDAAWAGISKEYELTQSDYEGFVASYRYELCEFKYHGDLGDNVKVSAVKILEERDLGVIGLETTRAQLKDEYNIPRKDVDDAKIVVVSYTLSGDLDSTTQTATLQLYKMGSTYYVYDALKVLDVNTIVEDTDGWYYNYYTLTDLIKYELEDREAFKDDMHYWVTGEEVTEE